MLIYYNVLLSLLGPMALRNLNHVVIMSNARRCLPNFINVMIRAKVIPLEFPYCIVCAFVYIYICLLYFILN